MSKKRQYRDFSDLLKIELKEPELAIAYLNEALANGDKTVFLRALKDVIEARGDISAFAHAAHMPRQNIYRILSDQEILPLISFQLFLMLWVYKCSFH
jgi:DNA-binding phage protein